MKLIFAAVANFNSLRFPKSAGFSCAVFLALLALGGSARASATNYTWNSSGTNFNGSIEWSTGTTTSTSIATGGEAVFNGPETVNPSLTGTISIAELNFGTSTSYGYDLTGSSTLTLTNVTGIASNNTVGTNTIAVPLNLAYSATGTQTISQASGGVLILSGLITGSQLVSFQGTTTAQDGTIQVSGTSNTYSGGTQIGTSYAAVVQVDSLSNGSGGSLGTGTITIGAGTNQVGNVLNYIGGTESSNQVILAGSGPGSNGGSYDVIDTTGASGTLTLTGGITGAVTGTVTGNSLATLGLDGTDTSGGDEISGTISNGSNGNGSITNLGVAKFGVGTWTLAPTLAETYTGTTTVSGGTLNVSFANLGAVTTNVINGATYNNPLVMGINNATASSETLVVMGQDNANDTQYFEGSTGSTTQPIFVGGAAHVDLVPGSSGTITVTFEHVNGTNPQPTLGAFFNPSATVDFSIPTNAAVTVSTGTVSVDPTSGLLPGGFTINESDFATISGSNLVSDSTLYKSIASSGTLTTADQVNNLAAGSATTGSSTVTVAALRFAGTGSNGAGNTTLTLNGELIVNDSNSISADSVSEAAILVPTGAGNNLYDINGGSIIGASGRALDLLQYDTTGTLEIDSTILYASNMALTKSGGGVVLLTGANTYVGNTYLNEGTLRTTNGNGLGFGGVVGSQGVAVGNTQVAAGATLDLAPATAMTVDEPIQLLGGSLTNSGSGTTTLDNGIAGIQWTGTGANGTPSTGNISITPNGYGASAGGTGATGTYTIASSGSLTAIATTAAGSGYGTAPTVTITGQPSADAETAVLSSLSLSGQANQIGGTGALVINAAISNGAAPTGYSLAEAEGQGGFIKTGTDTVTLTGANTYGGGTIITGGTLLANGIGSASTNLTATQPGSSTMLTNINTTSGLVVGETVYGGSYAGTGNSGFNTITAINSSTSVTVSGSAVSTGTTTSYTFGAYGATGIGSIAVNNGTLGGSGTLTPTLGGITVAATGTITPGTTPSGTAPGGFLTVIAATAPNGITFAASSSNTAPQLTFNLGTGSAPTDGSGATFAGASSYIKLALDTAGEVAFNSTSTTYLSLNNLAGGTLSGNYLLFQGAATGTTTGIGNSDYTGLSTTLVSGSGATALYSITGGLAIASNSSFAGDSLYLEDGDIFVTAASVPEPSTWALLFIGLASLAVWRRRGALFA
jgi:autotransporter-associated beta strand protein